MTRQFMDAPSLVKIKSARAWKINEQDVPEGSYVALAGNIFAIVPRDGDYGRYPVVILDANDGVTYAIHAFHEVLFNNLREIKAAAGMDVVFTYAGKREHNTKVDADGNKRRYHDWSVVPADGAEIEMFDLDSEQPQF